MVSLTRKEREEGRYLREFSRSSSVFRLERLQENAEAEGGSGEGRKQGRAAAGMGKGGNGEGQERGTAEGGNGKDATS